MKEQNEDSLSASDELKNTFSEAFAKWTSFCGDVLDYEFELEIRQRYLDYLDLGLSDLDIELPEMDLDLRL